MAWCGDQYLGLHRAPPRNGCIDRYSRVPLAGVSGGTDSFIVRLLALLVNIVQLLLMLLGTTPVPLPGTVQWDSTSYSRSRGSEWTYISSCAARILPLQHYRSTWGMGKWSLREIVQQISPVKLYSITDCGSEEPDIELDSFLEMQLMQYHPPHAGQGVSMGLEDYFFALSFFSKIQGAYSPRVTQNSIINFRVMSRSKHQYTVRSCFPNPCNAGHR